MTDITATIPLKRVVAMALDENDQSIASFDKAWVLGFRAQVDLLLDISAQPTEVRLPLNGNKTVAFPPDTIGWISISIMNNNGERSTLRINNALSKIKDNNPNRLSKLTADVTDAFPLVLSNPYYLNFFYNGQYQPLYGVGGGLVQYGSCVVDEENRLIILAPDFQYDSIIFEYFSSPEKNGDYEIPITCQEAVIAFIKWKSKQGPREEYYAAKKEARARMPKKKVHLQSINQVLRESEAMKLRS